MGVSWTCDAVQSRRTLMCNFNPLQFQKVYANPFPVNSSYQQCRGSTPITRGYTCGLWTTFHALTVHTYIDTIKDDLVDPMKPLKAIQVMSNLSKSGFKVLTWECQKPHDLFKMMIWSHSILHYIIVFKWSIEIWWQSKIKSGCMMTKLIIERPI